MSAPNIIIYTVHPEEWPCEYCDKAKAWLDERGYECEEVKMYVEDRLIFYHEHGLTGKQRTMPQIFVNGTRIGGYAELKEMEDL